MTLFATVLLFASLLAPEQPIDREFPESVALVASTRPIRGMTYEETAAWLVATSWFESRLGAQLVGDSGKSCGYGHRLVGHGPACWRLITDTREAVERMRDDLDDSFATCGTTEKYITGKCGKEPAQSRHRAFVVKQILNAVGDNT